VWKGGRSKKKFVSQDRFGIDGQKEGQGERRAEGSRYIRRSRVISKSAAKEVVTGFLVYPNGKCGETMDK